MDIGKALAILTAVLLVAGSIVNYELGACWGSVDPTLQKFLKSKKKLRILFSIREPYITDRRRYVWPYPERRESLMIFLSSIMTCAVLLMIALYSGVNNLLPESIEDVAINAYFVGAMVFSVCRGLAPRRILPPFWTKKLK